MPKKRRNGRNGHIEELEIALTNNGKAYKEGPKRKTWSTHDLRTIKPLTAAQEDMFHAWFNGDNIVAHGSAGTGKTFLAFYLALLDTFQHKRQSEIIVIRSAVPTREIGYLPGDLDEKTAQYELPYHDIVYELIGKSSSYQDMKDAGVIRFMTTSFLRGLTWDNAIIIIDEGENMTFHEINTIMTRVGHNTRIIFTGDLTQTDLDGSKRLGSSGMTQTLDVIRNMKEFEDVCFTVHDIVRSEFVKSWILATESVAA